MIFAGIDIGSRTTGAAIMEDGKILSSAIIFTGLESEVTAKRAMDEALKGTPLSLADMACVVATGYGRVSVPFADEIITEISCHAKGANWYFPSVRTVLDMGGQDCKAIRVNALGIHTNFAMNDKCAAGTGRFLEVMAELLGIPLEEIGELSLRAENEVKISSTCTVFARTEVNSLIRDGVAKVDILGGLHEAISNRVYGLLRRVGIEKDFVITGGIAKNIGVVRRLEKKVGVKALIPDEPQIVGGVGAAIMARERYLAKQRGVEAKIPMAAVEPNKLDTVVDIDHE